MHERAIGVEQDYVAAMKWCRRAAKQGYADAQYSLATMYKNGRGVAEDPVEAVKWARLAAEQGHVFGQISVALGYLSGSGGVQDSAEGAKWFSLAAEHDVLAELMQEIELTTEPAEFVLQYVLGAMYDFGLGVREDDAEAARWYRLAAEQGYASAQYKLGYLYVNSDGIERDLVQAYMWFRIVDSSGEELTAEAHDVLEEHTTPEEIAEAERLAHEWLAAHP